MTTIAVVDYGMGNLRSVAKAIEHVAPRARTVVSSKVDEIASADRVVFPGQGAARDCMANLQSCGLSDVVLSAYKNKPFLGICMGLQVLFDSSDENGGVECLGSVAGKVLRFDRTADKAGHEAVKNAGKIPHMGWNEVAQNGEHELWKDIEDRARFYFVHSYYVQPQKADIIAGKTSYLINFCSAIAKDNVFATQFHPEKSADNGLRLLKNFSQWQPN